MANKIPRDVDISKYVAGGVVVFDLQTLTIKWIANILYPQYYLLFSLIVLTSRSHHRYDQLSWIYLRKSHSGRYRRRRQTRYPCTYRHWSHLRS